MAVLIGTLIVPAGAAGQERGSQKPSGSRSAPSARSQARPARQAQPRAEAARARSQNRGQSGTVRHDGSRARTRTAEPDRSSGRDRDGGAGIDGRHRGDRPALGAAVPRSHAPIGRRGFSRYGYRSPYFYRSYGIDHFYYDPFWWGFPVFFHGVPVSTLGAYAYEPYESPFYEAGGLRLKVKPRSAEVYADGYYIGRVDDFDGIFQRAQLAPGPHRIEIVEPGYEPLSVDIRVLPGETITYEGELRALRP